MGRPARALLHAQALRHNFQQVRRRAPGARVMAVVKANGYGHGLAWVAQTLKEADAFAVASVEEGFQLRQAGIQQPIVLLEGFFQADELPTLAHYDLWPVVHHDEQLRMLESVALAKPLGVWLKIDSGMHRIGFAPAQARAVYEQLRACRTVREVRLMSHLASADDPDDPATRRQLAVFLPLARELGVPASCANSAGIIAWPDSHLDWVRPGIMLYGATPMLAASAQQLELQPTMTLTSALIAVHLRAKGEAIGYGGDYRCPQDMPVGVAAIGYGDGYPRHAAPGTPVLVNGRPVPLIGRVSMDMITVDLRSQPHARVGDPVVLWGEGLPVEDVARHAGTIAYELLCHVAERIPRIAAAAPAAVAQPAQRLG